MEKSHDLIGVNIPAFEWKAQEQWRRSGGNDGKYKYIYIQYFLKKESRLNLRGSGT